jgi:hypothetical protein
MSNQPEYDWYGDWQGPGVGKYVIRCNNEEIEPGDVISLLDDYNDLLEQVIRTFRGKKDDTEKTNVSIIH